MTTRNPATGEEVPAIILIDLSHETRTISVVTNNVVQATQTRKNLINMLQDVHAEMFYNVGIIGILKAVIPMEVVMTPKGFRFKEQKIERIAQGQDEDRYVEEALRWLAAYAANKYMDGLLNVQTLEEKCEYFITMLAEAAEQMTHNANNVDDIL